MTEDLLDLEETSFSHQGLEWIPESSCHGMQSDLVELLFFPRNAKEVNNRAWDAVCDSCPVRAQCTDWGKLINGYGVFGGEFRRLDLPQNRNVIDTSANTVGGNKPGWKLLKKGSCKHKHQIVSEEDLHIRRRVRQGVETYEAECYHCWKVTRNKTPSFRKKSGPRSERRS